MLGLQQRSRCTSTHAQRLQLLHVRADDPVPGRITDKRILERWSLLAGSSNL